MCKFFCVGLTKMDQMQTCMQDGHKEDTCLSSAFVFVSVLVFEQNVYHKRS